VLVKRRPLAAKRALDLSLTVVTAPLWLPLIGVVGLMVLLSYGRPIFFRQLRPGLHGEPFELLKFRTMTEERDSSGQLLPDEERITRVGSLLRKLSLDEIPELLLVVKGDMSLVGPRPLLMEYLDNYSPQQARRHEVPPGITGWAQVNGRNGVGWDQRFELDVEYVDSHSPVFDLRILAMTVTQVTRRHGISAEGHATMPKFGDDG